MSDKRPADRTGNSGPTRRRAAPSCFDAVLASMQNAVFGLPYIVSSPASHEGAARGPHGFPFWIRWSHFFNMIFLFMLIRSGLSILVDHPRLYFNDHCTLEANGFASPL
jgi:hypothetical protein